MVQINKRRETSAQKKRDFKDECVIISAVVCYTQVMLTCPSIYGRQNKLLRLEVNNLSQEVEAFKKQSRENHQKE